MAPPTNLLLVTATIQAGQSLSNACNLTTGQLVSITVDDWTPAEMTFQISPDGIDFADLFSQDGREVALLATQYTAFFTDGLWTKVVRWIKIRSGTRNVPTPQRDTVNITLALET